MCSYGCGQRRADLVAAGRAALRADGAEAARLLATVASSGLVDAGKIAAVAANRARALSRLARR
jgi:hypothetical protein